MSDQEQNGKGLPAMPALLSGAQAGEAAPPRTEPRPPSKEEIDAGSRWIARWKEAGGGFYFFPQGKAGVMVQLAYERQEEEEDQAALDRIQPIQQELLDDDRLRAVVIDLAASAWMRRSMPAEGNA